MRFLRDPLLHFLLLGAALFLISGLGGKSPNAITVTPSQIEKFTADFARTHQRPPTQPELDSLIQDYVLAEAYNREAVSRGLDKDDAVIRERLQMKMQFIAEGVAWQAEPSDADLETYLRAHAAEFRGDAHFTFTQIFLDPARHGKDISKDTAQLLSTLQQSASNPDLIPGDPSLQDRKFNNATTADVLRAFGEDFTHSLYTLPLNQWQGPVTSRYGPHLVLLTTRVPGRDPPLAEVRPAIRKALIEERRLEATLQFERDMLKRFPPDIRWPNNTPHVPPITTAPSRIPGDSQ